MNETRTGISLSVVLGGGLRCIREVLWRTRRHGWRAGWTALRAHAWNFYIRIRNQMCRHPRVACPCCGWEGHAFRILDVGHWIVPQVECPQCGQHDRHRMLHFFFMRRPPAFLRTGSRVLHVSPEAETQRFLRAAEGLRLFASDLQPGATRHAVTSRCFSSDLTCMSVRDAVFDGIVCIHVLEHIRDDRRALQEIARILKPAGTALIMVPFAPVPDTREFERPNPLIYNHVRDYSISDFPARLSAFDVEPIAPHDILSEEERRRFQVPDNHVVYCCRRRAT